MSPTEQGAMVRIYRQEDKSVTEVWRDGKLVERRVTPYPFDELSAIKLSWSAERNYYE